MKKLFLTEIALFSMLATAQAAQAEPASVTLAAHSDVNSVSPQSASAKPVIVTPPLLELDGKPQPEPLVVPEIKTIVIDPGHGGSNEGAIGTAGIHEKYLTLKLALVLADRLRERFPEAKIILTRESDQFLSLSDRIAIANDAQADLFLSLHFNSSLNPLAIGFESFYAGDFAQQESERLGDAEDVREAKKKTEPYAQFMAECFNHAMGKRFNVLDRGVKPGDYTVLTRALVPAVVLEFGFLSNAEEGLELIKPEHQSKMIDALVEAVSRYQKGHS